MYVIIPLIFSFVNVDSNDKTVYIKTAYSSSILQSELKNLRSSMSYIITIEAVVETNNIDKTTNISKEVVHTSLPATLRGNTSPRAPHLRLVKAGYNKVSIKWSAPHSGNGEKVIEYLVKYQIMDVNGSSSVQGTGKIQSALTKTDIEITGLAMGILYGFSVKVSVVVYCSPQFFIFSSCFEYHDFRLFFLGHHRQWGEPIFSKIVC